VFRAEDVTPEAEMALKQSVVDAYTARAAAMSDEELAAGITRARKFAHTHTTEEIEVFEAERASRPPPDPDGGGLDLGEAVDPNIAALDRQRAELGAEAPLRHSSGRAPTEQESTLGFGLFGAADGVRLDPDGEAR